MIWLELPLNISKATVLVEHVNTLTILPSYDSYLFVKRVCVYAEGINMPKRGRYATLSKKMH